MTFIILYYTMTHHGSKTDSCSEISNIHFEKGASQIQSRVLEGDYKPVPWKICNEIFSISPWKLQWSLRFSLMLLCVQTLGGRWWQGRLVEVLCVCTHKRARVRPVRAGTGEQMQGKDNFSKFKITLHLMTQRKYSFIIFYNCSNLFPEPFAILHRDRKLNIIQSNNLHGLPGIFDCAVFLSHFLFSFHGGPLKNGLLYLVAWKGREILDLHDSYA